MIRLPARTTLYSRLGIRSMTNVKKVEDMRIDYREGILLEDDAGMDPFTLFESWFKQASTKANEHDEPNAMCISTCNKSTGRPSSRMVLMKHFDHKGFVFYTNYNSRKGQELMQNPYASAVFWWGKAKI